MSLVLVVHQILDLIHEIILLNLELGVVAGLALRKRVLLVLVCLPHKFLFGCLVVLILDTRVLVHVVAASQELDVVMSALAVCASGSERVRLVAPGCAPGFLRACFLVPESLFLGLTTLCVLCGRMW